MDQFIQNMLIGIRQWVNGKIADVNTAIDGKQDTLTAGENIEITSAGTISVTGITEPIASDFDIKDLADSEGLREEWGGKQDALTAGDNIEITSGGTISVTGIINDSVVSYDTTYSSSKILDLVNAIAQFNVEVVDALPESGMTTNTIYLVPSSNWNFGDNLEITFSEKNNERDEYLWIIDESTGEGRWELIGSTQISLADYYTVEEVNHLLDEKQNEVDVTVAEVLAVLNELDQRVTALENS